MRRMIRSSWWRGLALALALAGVVGCGDDAGQQRREDAAVPDDAAIDATPSDGPADAAAPLPANEITSAATAVRGKRFKADVQIGHPIGQQPATGNGTRIEANSAVKP